MYKVQGKLFFFLDGALDGFPTYLAVLSGMFLGTGTFQLNFENLIRLGPGQAASGRVQNGKREQLHPSCRSLSRRKGVAAARARSDGRAAAAAHCRTVRPAVQAGARIRTAAAAQSRAVAAAAAVAEH